MEAFAYIRDHFIKSKTVTIENDDIVCVGLNGEEIKRFPKHIPTAFHSKTSKKPYDLLAIVTCFKYATLPFGEYVTKCRAEKAGMVSTVDKKELIAFLKGDIDTSAQIHSLETDAIPPEKSPQIQPKETGSPSKRQKTEPEGDTDRETLISAKIDDQKSAIDPQNVSDKVMQRIFAKERTFRNRTPIIVVPAGYSDLFTMYNVKDFLQDGVYVPIHQKKDQGLRKDQAFTIVKEYNGEEFKFKVVDSVNRFRDKEWSCVVGVLVSGQTWQFKGWKWAFPLQVFKRVCGIHIHRQGSQLSDEIKKWDVKILMIHPDKRHLDKVAAKEFWRYLFEHLKLRLQ
ncbi:unnamed protein product [Albugo candida]|uniref:Cell division control protein 73 C-terminal domain-containing protein n=1 Tax=Albugo candida TaxID=65357 RepID=A0A024FYN5_9STRA|nr:unnamed protein product [Albugo candida]|eukprot:CCI39527.1 unnamed protein product [Albugo candida]